MHRFAHWQRALRAHPLRAHIGLLLLLKLIALFAIYHYFFSPAERAPIDNARVAERMLHASARLHENP